MVDTHCHLNLPPLIDNAATHIERCKQAGVEKLLIIGTDIPTSTSAIYVAKTYQQWASVGIHPELGALLALYSIENRKSLLSVWKTQLAMLSENHECVAIGECGLDYSEVQSDTVTNEQIRSIQVDLFTLQAKLAAQKGLPLSIHCRSTRGREAASFDAYADLLAILTSLSRQNQLPRFVLHCVSGPIDYVQECIRLGGFVSFAGNVTYPSATQIQDLLSIVPANRILLETDAPFLSPQGLRGSVNTPANVMQTAAFVATKLEIDQQQLDAQTTANASALFSI